MNFHAEVSGNRPLELPLMFGHFLPWYTRRGGDFPLLPEDRALLPAVPTIEDFRHWNDARAGYRRTHHHVPLLGCYDSRDPAVIAWQIRTAIEYGLGGFIINWHGTCSVENVITLHWLRGLLQWNREHPESPFHYFISFDAQAQWSTEGRQPLTREQDFAFIRDHLMTDAYLHRDGRPVFSVFPYEDNGEQFRAVLDLTFPAGADLLWSGSPAGRGEDACYAWVRPDADTIDLSSPYAWSQPDSAGDGALRQLYADAERAGGAYVMHGVWPGFNNQFVSWAWSRNPENPRIRPCVICRETIKGNTLDLTWRPYLEHLEACSRGERKVPAPLIQLVTWNDYAETTTVEPTRDYGTAPLEVCRENLLKARRLWRRRTG
jgi:hypothetical protein